MDKKVLFPKWSGEHPPTTSRRTSRPASWDELN
jgi:hypothetical protein